MLDKIITIKPFRIAYLLKSQLVALCEYVCFKVLLETIKCWTKSN